MYCAHFHLRRRPFELSPDPYFLYPTPRHNEALANLYHAVSGRRGFVVLTGEVGTGKTLLLRCLFDLLDRRQVAFAYLFNPRLTPEDFLQHLLGDLNLSTELSGKSARLRVLNQFLLERHRRQLTTALVVDEAQHLSPEVLEEIRLLTNLETTSQKLLQIVLAGQPELEDLLDSSPLRQLKQRVALRCRLAALDPEETAGYIHRRLERALEPGAAADLFPAPVVAAIYRASQGIPRLINTLCENALVTAFAHQLPAVTEAIIAEVVEDFRLGAPPAAPSPVAHGDERRQLVALLLRLARQLEGQPDASPELEWELRAAAKGGSA
ncbi:MAG: ExeA family protein [Terriglobales bacterium]